VLLLEETDWIGVTVRCGVTTMDEDGVWMKFPVRERGIYREFHESMVLYYQTLDKDPFVAYYSWPDQLEGGYEPKAARAVLYGFIKEARERGGVLDLSLRTRVSSVKKQGDNVTGATLAFADGSRQDVACQVLIDATEYGDIIPLTGPLPRGNCTSDKVDPAAQDHTWTCVVRESGGEPEHLQIKRRRRATKPAPANATASSRATARFFWGSARAKASKGRGIGPSFRQARHGTPTARWLASGATSGTRSAVSTAAMTTPSRLRPSRTHAAAARRAGRRNLQDAGAAPHTSSKSWRELVVGRR
jgi:hypothetical protein